MGENSSKIGCILSTKMTITRKINIAKTRNLIFISIQSILDLSYRFDKFQQKKLKILKNVEQKKFNFIFAGTSSPGTRILLY